MTKLAPILIQVYDRKQHFINCVQSLSKCHLADKSHLFIVSDAAKTIETSQVIDEIREYCKYITGFDKVELIALDTNFGVIEASKVAIKRIFEEYDTMIYTEDDNFFSPNFLHYINEGLTFYRNYSNVFAICGYRHPFDFPKDYPYTTFYSTIMSAWGIGLWKNKYLDVEFQVTDFDKKQITHLAKKMPILWHELIEKASKGHVYGDAIMEYHCLKNNMVNVFPYISLVRNYGNDGSGVNCGTSNVYSSQKIGLGHEQFVFRDNTAIDLSMEKKVVNAIDFPMRKNGFEIFILKKILTTKKIIKKAIIKSSILRELKLLFYKHK